MPKSMNCPDCKGPTFIRSSREVTVTSRQAVLVCKNYEACGGSYGLDQAITHRISPSAMPNEALGLRTAPPRVPANDNLGSQPPITSAPEVAPAANENEGYGEAVATAAS